MITAKAEYAKRNDLEKRIKEIEAALEAGKIVYPVSKEEMKYKRNAMDKTNEIIYNAIKGNSRVSIEELNSISGLSRTTVHFRIKRFKELGIIGHPEEAGRKREWQIRKEWSAEEERKLLM